MSSAKILGNSINLCEYEMCRTCQTGPAGFQNVRQRLSVKLIQMSGRDQRFFVVTEFKVFSYGTKAFMAKNVFT